MNTGEIIIIDADREWVDSVSQTLHDAGHRVRTVNRGEEGSDLLAGADPALVVIDAHLPGYNGLHLLPEFRRRHPSTPVLVVSGEGRASVRDEALTLGANGFLQKPVAPTVVLAAIRRLLGDAMMQAG